MPESGPSESQLWATFQLCWPIARLSRPKAEGRLPPAPSIAAPQRRCHAGRVGAITTEITTVGVGLAGRRRASGSRMVAGYMAPDLNLRCQVIDFVGVGYLARTNKPRRCRDGVFILVAGARFELTTFRL
jgi:hypothetical protein